MKSTIAILGVAIILAFGCVGQAGQGLCLPTSGTVCGNNAITYNNSCNAAAAGTTVNHTGACAAPSCTDSDGGKDIFTKGTAGSIKDACINPNTVDEAYCNGSQAKLEALTCSLGYECKDGACVKSTCTDTDGGKDAETKGTATAQGISKTDACSGSFSVNEYFCDGINISNASIACGTGQECVDGACREAACTSPEGNDSETAGTTKKGADSYNDTCVDNASAKKYYCEANEIKSKTVACAEGYRCSAGKCAKEACVDSDGGNDTETRGTASYNGTSYTDSCYSGTSVLEYYCSSDTAISSVQIACGTGQECYEGACRAAVCVDNKTNVSVADARHLVGAFDGTDTLTLYIGDAVEINSGMFLGLADMNENYSTFMLYDNYTAFQNSEELCSKKLAAGDNKTSLCSRNIGGLEINDINNDEGYAEITLKNFFVTQHYSENGSIDNWTDNAMCNQDTAAFKSHASYFYPYISPGMNLEGNNFMLFGQEAEIVDITNERFTFNLGGNEYAVSDGKTFKYYGRTYRVSLEYSDGGLHAFTVKPD